LPVDARIDGERRRCMQQRVAVGRRLRHEIGADDAVRSRSVIYHEILAGLERKLLRDDACGRVRAARAEADHDAHRPARVALAPARTRHNTEYRSQKYQGRRFSLHHTGNIAERLLKKTNESRRETQMAISHENKSAARQGRSDLRLSACIFGSLL